MPSSREAKKGQNELNNDKRRLYRTLNRRTALHGRWVPGIVREPNGITVHLMEDGNATLVHPDGTTLHLTTATGDAVRITPDGVSRRSLIRDNRPPQALGPAAVAVASMARSVPVVFPPPAPAQPAPPPVALAHPPPTPLELGHGLGDPPVLAPSALALPEVPPPPPPPRMAVPAVLAWVDGERAVCGRRVDGERAVCGRRVDGERAIGRWAGGRGSLDSRRRRVGLDLSTGRMDCDQRGLRCRSYWGRYR